MSEKMFSGLELRRRIKDITINWDWESDTNADVITNYARRFSDVIKKINMNILHDKYRITESELLITSYITKKNIIILLNDREEKLFTACTT